MSDEPPPDREDDPFVPVPRAYSRQSGIRDRDAFRTAQNLRIGVWSLIGAFLGLVAGWLSGHMILGGVLGGLAMFGLVRFLLDGAGAFAGTLHNPSGASTPRAREHSRAEALVVHGRFRAAVEAFEEAVAEDPTDPTPYLRIARIHRDHLDELEEAATWFRRALREAEMPAGQARLARRELVELFIHRMNEPARAAPELARMRDEWAGTEEGAWAARELARVKAAMRDGGGEEG